MTLAAFNGYEALTFTDYLDLETGKTLHAEPGGTYDVAPASGRAVPDIPAAWFAPLEQDGDGDEDSGALPEGDSVPPEPGTDEAHSEDPETEIPREF